jgi:Holliday junction DNA helicase RuvA
VIGRLRGTLLDKKPPSLLLDVNGVGYEVEAPMTTFYDLPETGNEITLHTHLVVREDAQLLYGFSRESDRRLFRQLIKVTGVGAKMAIAILSGTSASEFARCVQEGDITTLTRIPGIGKKTAERLVVEMRDRLASGEEAVAGVALPTHVERPADAVGDAVSALIALGYKPQEASRWVRGVDSSGLSSEEIIRQALQRAAG